jgi:hypothetical protein
MYLDLDDNNIKNVLTDDLSIHKSIYNIIITRKGTIPGYPEFGCSVQDYLFEQLDYITEQSLISELEEALNKFEPRIKVLGINTKDIPQDNSMYVEVVYYILDNGVEGNVKIKLR